MSRRNRLLRSLEIRWVARFGEPPVIRTDPRLMEAVLEDDLRRNPHRDVDQVAA